MLAAFFSLVEGFLDEKLQSCRIGSICIEGGQKGLIWMQSGHFLDTFFAGVAQR